jgi:hypothetical protein
VGCAPRELSALEEKKSQGGSWSTLGLEDEWESGGCRKEGVLDRQA